MPEAKNFAYLMNDNFLPAKRISIFRQASNKEKFAYLFDENHLPTIGAWYIAGEILVWAVWFFWLLANAVIWLMGGAPDLVIESFLIRGDLLDYNWGMIETVFIFFIGCAVLYFALIFGLIFGTYFYPVLSLVIYFANKTKQKSTFWFILVSWAIFCFLLAMWVGKDMLTSVVIDGEWQLVLSVWTDWIDPDQNSLMLILGYPVSVFLIGCTLIINIFYYKYKPENGDKNWSAEGLDAHFLDGDADN